MFGWGGQKKSHPKKGVANGKALYSIKMSCSNKKLEEVLASLNLLVRFTRRFGLIYVNGPERISVNSEAYQPLLILKRKGLMNKNIPLATREI